MTDRFERFVLSISQANRYVQRIKSMEMHELGLRGNHVMCLYYLSKHEQGLTAAELSELCGEDRAAISRTTKELEAKGFAQFDSMQGKKKYRTKLHLSDEGTKIVAIIHEKINKILAVIGDGLDEGQRENFYESLGLILQNLQSFYDGKRDEVSESY